MGKKVNKIKKTNSLSKLRNFIVLMKPLISLLSAKYFPYTLHSPNAFSSLLSSTINMSTRGNNKKTKSCSICSIKFSTSPKEGPSWNSPKPAALSQRRNLIIMFIIKEIHHKVSTLFCRAQPKSSSLDFLTKILKWLLSV